MADPPRRCLQVRQPLLGRHRVDTALGREPSNHKHVVVQGEAAWPTPHVGVCRCGSRCLGAIEPTWRVAREPNNHVCRDNVIMPRAPYIIAASVFGTCVAVAVHLSTGPGPFAQGSGVVLGIGYLIYGVIAVAGLLLARGRWARRLAAGLATAGLITASLTAPWTAAAITTVGLAAVALVGVAGRRLDAWIRQQPSADGPGPAATMLVLLLIGLVPAVALAAPSNVTSWHGVLGGAGLFLAWAFARAEIWALWTIRLALPVLAIPALLRSPALGSLSLGVFVTSLVALSWTREARLAVQPLMDNLPGPRTLGERNNA